MKKKDIICDSGSLISLTSGCLDNLLYFFSEKFGVRFLIPPSVEYETITRPLENDVRKYLFSAIRIKDAITDGVIIKIDDEKIKETSETLAKEANSLFFVRGKPIKLIHLGETEMLALSLILGVDNILLDERTARMLVEDPTKIKTHFESEFHVNVMVNKNNMSSLTSKISRLQPMRSSELVMLAYEQGYFDSFQDYQKEALEAALYKIKFSGCSISFEEIDAYLGNMPQHESKR